MGTDERCEGLPIANMEREGKNWQRRMWQRRSKVTCTNGNVLCTNFTFTFMHSSFVTCWVALCCFMIVCMGTRVNASVMTESEAEEQFGSRYIDSLEAPCNKEIHIEISPSTEASGQSRPHFIRIGTYEGGGDDGGNDKEFPYHNDVVYCWTIQAPLNRQVAVSVEELLLEESVIDECFDMLSFHDGFDFGIANSTIDVMCGDSPPSDLIVAPGTRMGVRFFTDSDTTEDGAELRINSLRPYNVPVGSEKPVPTPSDKAYMSLSSSTCLWNDTCSRACLKGFELGYRSAENKYTLEADVMALRTFSHGELDFDKRKDDGKLIVKQGGLTMTLEEMEACVCCGFELRPDLNGRTGILFRETQNDDGEPSEQENTSEECTPFIPIHPESKELAFAGSNSTNIIIGFPSQNCESSYEMLSGSALGAQAPRTFFCMRPTVCTCFFSDITIGELCMLPAVALILVVTLIGCCSACCTFSCKNATVSLKSEMRGGPSAKSVHRLAGNFARADLTEDPDAFDIYGDISQETQAKVHVACRGSVCARLVLLLKQLWVYAEFDRQFLCFSFRPLLVLVFVFLGAFSSNRLPDEFEPINETALNAAIGAIFLSLVAMVLGPFSNPACFITHYVCMTLVGFLTTSAILFQAYSDHALLNTSFLQSTFFLALFASTVLFNWALGFIIDPLRKFRGDRRDETKGARLQTRVLISLLWTGSKRHYTSTDDSTLATSAGGAYQSQTDANSSSRHPHHRHNNNNNRDNSNNGDIGDAELNFQLEKAIAISAAEAGMMSSSSSSSSSVSPGSMEVPMASYVADDGDDGSRARTTQSISQLPIAVPSSGTTDDTSDLTSTTPNRSARERGLQLQQEVIDQAQAQAQEHDPDQGPQPPKEGEEGRVGNNSASNGTRDAPDTTRTSTAAATAVGQGNETTTGDVLQATEASDNRGVAPSGIEDNSRQSLTQPRHAIAAGPGTEPVPGTGTEVGTDHILTELWRGIRCKKRSTTSTAPLTAELA